MELIARILLTLVLMMALFSTGCGFSANIGAGASKDAEDDGGNDDDDDNGSPQLGAFAISGVTGGTDVTVDANLKNGLVATVNWAASSNATSYEVAIYESNGTSVKCTAVNTTSTSYNFSSCNLTTGTTYRAKVTSKLGASTLFASNNSFAFLVYNKFNASNVPTYYVLADGSMTVKPFEGGTSPACTGGTCTLSIDSASNGTNGAASTNGSAITYTPTAGFTGTDSIPYVVDDGNGGTVNTSLAVKVVSPYTWLGLGLNANWNNNANWCGSVSSDHLGCENGAAPTSSVTASHIAVFDGACASNCSPNITANASVYGVRLKSGYGGTVTQAAGNTLTVGAGGWTQAAGIFEGGNSALAIGGTVAFTGGEFTASSGTTSISGGWNPTALTAFDANNGTLSFTCGGACTITPTAATYNNVTFAGTNATFALGGNSMTIAGDLVLNGTTSQVINSGNLNVGGDVTTSGIGATGSGIVRVTGNASGQTITGITAAKIPNLVIVATTNDVTLSGDVNIAGNYTYTSADTFTTAGSTLIFSGENATYTVSTGASILYDNVKFVGSTAEYNLGSDIDVGGDLEWGDLTTVGGINNNIIYVLGDLIATNAGYIGTTALVVMAASGTRSIVGDVGSRLPSLHLTGGADYVMSGEISVDGDFRYSSTGVLTTTGSTLIMTGGGSSYNFYAGGQTYDNMTLALHWSSLDFQGDTVQITGNLSIGDAGGYGYSIDNGVLEVGGDLVAERNGNKGSVLVKMVGNAAGQTITSVTNAAFPSVEIDAGANTVTMFGTVAFLRDFTYTSGTLVTAGSIVRFDSYYDNVNVTPGNITYENVELVGECGNHTISGTFKVSGDLVLNDSGCAANLDGGTIEAGGSVGVLGLGKTGTTSLVFNSPGASTFTVANGAVLPTGNVTINTGGTLTLASDVTWTGVGQTVDVTGGAVNLAGFDMIIPDSLTLNGNTLTKNTGTLTVNSVVAGTGALFGGTVDP